jgi:hypothetical protein
MFWSTVPEVLVTAPVVGSWVAEEAVEVLVAAGTVGDMIGFS